MNLFLKAKRLVCKALCATGYRHFYPSMYEVRAIKGKRGRHMYKEFRFQCQCCLQFTDWQRWKHLPDFMQQHKPNWKNRRLNGNSD